MSFDFAPDHVDDQAAVVVATPLSMENSIHASVMPLRACCAKGREDQDALAQAMRRPRRTRRVA